MGKVETLILLFAFLAFPFPSRGAIAGCPSWASVPAGYVFWQGSDSGGNDIASLAVKTVAQLAAECNMRANCKGFTTTGYLKSYIKPLDQWGAKWTTDPCKGLLIRSPAMKVNGYTLSAIEQSNVRWIATWTLPNLGASRFNAIVTYLAKGVWWSLKEQVLAKSNPWDYSNCGYPSGNHAIGPLAVCQTGYAWQIGIAAKQVPNNPPSLANCETTALARYPGLTIPQILQRTAVQAGYSSGPTYNSIAAATSTLRKAWLLKNHLVAFTYIRQEVDGECLIATPKYWCYGTYGNTCTRCGIYAPTAASIPNCINDVKIMLQGLTHGQ